MKKLSENNLFVALFLTCMIYGPTYVPYFTGKDGKDLDVMHIVVPLLFFIIIYLTLKSLNEIENEKGKD